MSRVVVIGGSDQGRQTIDILVTAGEHEVVGVVDPALAVGSSVSGYQVVDPDGVDATGADGFIVAVGDNSVRAAVIARVRAERPALELVNAIHPAATVARDAVLAPGSTLMAGAVVSNGCVVGEGVLMGTNSSIDHDCTLAEYVSLAPGATTGGHVRIGACSAVGLGASVIHQVTIGAHTVIGAGAAVIGDVGDLVVAYGVPARVARTRSAGEPYLSRP